MLRRIFGEINAYKILVKKPEWDCLKDLSVDGRIILRWILKQCEGMDIFS